MPDPVESAPIYFKTQDDLVAQMAADMQALIPDLYTGEDGNFMMFVEILAGAMEGVYLANQIVSDDMFVQTASVIALQRHGDELGVEIEAGTKSTGVLRFEGDGGTNIGIGASVSYDTGFADEDLLNFVTLEAGSIPNPGTPAAPTAADGGAGALAAGTYEYAVAFTTAEGETILGAISNALVLGASKQVSLTAIPLGGPGTVGRKIYRRVNGGAFLLAQTIANNSATTLTDNNAAPAGSPLTVSTAQRISLDAESAEPGVDYNAVPNSITVLTDVPDGVTSVTNPLAFSGGQDEQDFEAFRTELLDKIRSPQTGSTIDIKGWSEDVAGVETATVFNNNNLGVSQNGHVTVRISGPNGSIPSADVIAAVLASLVEKDFGIITFHVTTFTAVPTNVTVVLTLESGVLLADVTQSVTQAITNYINALEAGETLRRNGIIDAVFGLPGIVDVSVTTPATDQTATATEKRTPGTISVT
jgi:uncharacterized phage protein gp47/JayE